jgi:hypothetical protein
MSMVFVLNNPEPIITFKGGVGYIFGEGPSESQSHPGNGQKSQGGGPASMLYAVLALHQGMGEYSEDVREAAENFVTAACRFLGERYGDGESDEVRIIDANGNNVSWYGDGSGRGAGAQGGRGWPARSGLAGRGFLWRGRGGGGARLGGGR